MSEWSAGYVDDINYTYGYYRELNPLWMRLALLNKGFPVPEISTACELGYGQGVSVNFHAAGTSVKWYGNDFNPAQASFAQELTELCDSKAKLTDDSFEEFLQRDDLPQFDYISLHGIWSWVSDENRRLIVQFIKKRLSVGGVLYVSYNTQPGWAAFAPLRQLMVQHADLMSGKGHGSLAKAGDAIDFVSKFLDTNPIYARANPTLIKRFEKVKMQPRDYLTHEYFNRDWEPMYFSQIADCLEDAKLQYACSASLSEHVDALNLTAEQQKFLQEVPDRMFKETIRDFMVGQQFRRDFWVKGLRSIGTIEASNLIRAQRLILIAPKPEGVFKITGALGEAEGADAIYSPIFDLMSDYKSRTFGEIESEVAKDGINFGKLMQAVMIIASAGYMHVAHEEEEVAKQEPKTQKLNRHILEKSRLQEHINYLVSPLTGGGIKAPRFTQLFLLAKSEGMNSAEEIAQFVWAILSQQNQKMTRDGKALESKEENIVELNKSTKDFLDNQLPIFRALKIA